MHSTFHSKWPFQTAFQKLPVSLKKLQIKIRSVRPKTQSPKRSARNRIKHLFIYCLCLSLYISHSLEYFHRFAMTFHILRMYVFTFFKKKSFTCTLFYLFKSFDDSGYPISSLKFRLVTLMLGLRYIIERIALPNDHISKRKQLFLSTFF